MPPFMKIEEYAKEKSKDYQGEVAEHVYNAILDGYIVGHEEGFDTGLYHAHNVIDNIPYHKPTINEAIKK